MADYTIGMFQLWVHDRRREAETVLPPAKEEVRGWIRLDAWIGRRVACLGARYPYQNVSSLPLFCLFEDNTDE